jgi:hypothetical protein
MRNILTTAAVLMGAVLFSTAAQASTSTVLHTNVPFTFVVNGRTLPAGAYTIQREDDGSAVLVIRSDNANEAVAFTTIPDGGHRRASTPTLSFTHVGGEYRLTGIWPNNDEGWDVSPR